jgi:hypothetical protein
MAAEMEEMEEMAMAAEMEENNKTNDFLLRTGDTYRHNTS